MSPTWACAGTSCCSGHDSDHPLLPQMKEARASVLSSRIRLRAPTSTTGPAEHRWAIRLRDRRGMTENSDFVSSYRTWRFAGLYADRTASGFTCGVSA